MAEKSDWLKQQGAPTYYNPSLETWGFLHCAQIKDAVDAANCYYRGNSNMLLLCIETEKVIPEITWDTSPYGVVFPHIHGPLNQDAIVDVLEFPIDADGGFILPEKLRG